MRTCAYVYDANSFFDRQLRNVRSFHKFLRKPKKKNFKLSAPTYWAASISCAPPWGGGYYIGAGTTVISLFKKKNFIIRIEVNGDIRDYQGACGKWKK